jgi:predicted dehydrogenase
MTQAKQTVSLGIIGIGNMGSSHAKNIVAGKIAGLTLTAVADRNPVRRAWAAENLPGVTVVQEGDDLLDLPGLDAVLVAVPHYGHAPLSIRAMEKGLHVLCEKPVSVTTRLARAMNEAADRTGRIFALMFNQRTNSLYRRMKEVMASGELGPMKRCSWIITNWYRSQSYYDSGDWRATWAGEGGGVLLNQCPHNLDLWQWICGMPDKVLAICHEGKWHDIEVEDDVTAYVEYPNGATGTFITSTADAPGTNRFEILCDGGKLVLENDILQLYRLETPERQFNATYQGGFGAPGHTIETLTTDGSNPQHLGVLQAFADAILCGTPLVADGREGILSLSLSNAMHLSGWLGQMVTLPLDEARFEAQLQTKIAGSRHKSAQTTVLSLEQSW